MGLSYSTLLPPSFLPPSFLSPVSVNVISLVCLLPACCFLCLSVSLLLSLVLSPLKKTKKNRTKHSLHLFAAVAEVMPCCVFSIHLCCVLIHFINPSLHGRPFPSILNLISPSFSPFHSLFPCGLSLNTLPSPAQ